MTRIYRDPSLIPHCARFEDLRRPYWTPEDYELMDRKFTCAMERAGYSVTSPSTSFGTRSPILGYERPDTLHLP
jgi:hypothetical protein